MRSQNGISACCSTALSGALLLGATFLSALTDPTLSHSALQMVQVVRPFFNSLTFDPGNTEGETEYALSQKSHYEVELALMECLRLLAPVSAEVVPVAPIREGNCGAPAAVLLQSLGDKEKVTFDPPLLLNCPMVVALGHWLESAQPAAKEAFNSPIAQVIGSSYSCRTAYNRPDTRLSQHAFANAVDLPVLILANRQQIDIAKEWGATRHDLAVAKRKLAPVTNLSEHQIRKRIPNNAEAVVPAGKSTTLAIAAYASTLNETSSSKAKVASLASLTNSLSTPQAKFLRRIHQAACRWFSTVLGPEANEEHRNHLHLDLQTRDSLNVCE